MLQNKLTLVIHSCDKFSDLWDTHIQLLNKNWSDRDIETLLVTDTNSEKQYDGVGIISAGAGTELSQRTDYALQHIKTEYVLITLDDYFPIHKIDSRKIEKLIEAMDKELLDYVRLFKRPDSNNKIDGYDNLYRIDLNSKRDKNYQVNLYSGIWRKSFIEKTIRKPLNAWSYELSLTKIAREINASCAMSKGNEFPVLDVVRKGQLLHKAARYLKKHNLYNGPRTVIPWSAEIKINVLTFIKDYTPQVFVDFSKSILRRFGWHFYSDEEI